MAKRKPPTTKHDGPYLAAAVFCETTLREQDGVVSAIRIVDQITLILDPTAPPDFPSETQRLPVHVKGLVVFRTGGSPGEHLLRIEIEPPSGKTQTGLEQTLPFSSRPHGGAHMHFDMVIQVKEGGLFWFHVLLDGVEFTRMPLHISIQRGATPAPALSTGVK